MTFIALQDYYCINGQHVELGPTLKTYIILYYTLDLKHVTKEEATFYQVIAI